jgi:hypothetical protein
MPTFDEILAEVSSPRWKSTWPFAETPIPDVLMEYAGPDMIPGEDY